MARPRALGELDGSFPFLLCFRHDKDAQKNYGVPNAWRIHLRLSLESVGGDLRIKTYSLLAMVIETLKGIDKYSREGDTPRLGKYLGSS
jgi:hypothetical protein